MKTGMILAASAIFLALTMAHQAESADASVATPIAGVDDPALARSARASKLIGEKIYKGDTSIGQIEDVLIDLDHATTAAVILSVGGFLGMGHKLVAVPPTAIKVGSEAKFTTDLTKDPSQTCCGATDRYQGGQRGQIHDGLDQRSANQRTGI